MATRTINPTNRIVRHLQRAVLLCDRTILSDGRLLEAFLTARDQTAFELLVKRHGPMVLGVCKRIIGNHHDAEEAFQAVFLVLARRAASVMPRELVGNWLHGVAYRTALHARGRLARHRARETQVKDMPQPTVSDDVDLRELHQALDRELDKLSDKYRLPIVLCDLEGRPRKDVAAQLQIPEGTLSSRLATGRQMLARKLARHGVTLSAAALAAVLPDMTASAMQPTLLAATVKAAVLSAAGQSAAALVSQQTLALCEGVLKTMFLSKLKVVSLVVLGIALGAFGAGIIGIPGTANQPTAQAADAQAADKPKQGGAANPEPLNGALLLDTQLQQDLRLSKNQIQKLDGVSKDVDNNNKGTRDEIRRLEKQVEELGKQIQQMRGGIEAQRSRAVGKAAPDILSAHAVQRVRQIQRQQVGLPGLLKDAKVQRMLKLNDEQWRKIEKVLKEQPTMSATFGTLAPYAANATWMNLSRSLNDAYFFHDSSAVRLWDVNTGKQLRQRYLSVWTDLLVTETAQNYEPLIDVLSDAQRKVLFQWVGEPYRSSPWQQVWDKYMKQK
jgi:RNA polymerase sigma factor (sigma-70 family)